MEKPIEPQKEDCCNSGCHPCIFDIYEKQLKLYEKYMNGENNHILIEENAIEQLTYTEFIVVSIINLCNSHNLITFKRNIADNKKVYWKPGDHFLYKHTLYGKSCTRAYTPLTSKLSGCDFAIIVKKYETGLVSPYLYELNVGSTTLWRGPYGHYEIQPNKFQRIIMIAQGTGILPFIAIIEAILNNEDDMTRITLFYCCKTINNILFRNELYNYKSYWNFQYEIYINSTLSNEKLKYQEPIKNSRLCFEDLHKFCTLDTNNQYLVCGSQNFNESYDIYLRKQYPLMENIILF